MASSSTSTDSKARCSQIPKVIKFGYDDYVVSGGKSTAKCKFCVHANIKITELSGTTSNYVRHLERVHNKR